MSVSPCHQRGCHRISLCGVRFHPLPFQSQCEEDLRRYSFLEGMRLLIDAANDIGSRQARAHNQIRSSFECLPLSSRSWAYQYLRSQIWSPDWIEQRHLHSVNVDNIIFQSRAILYNAVSPMRTPQYDMGITSPDNQRSIPICNGGLPWAQWFGKRVQSKPVRNPIEYLITEYPVPHGVSISNFMHALGSESDLCT